MPDTEIIFFFFQLTISDTRDWTRDLSHEVSCATQAISSPLLTTPVTVNWLEPSACDQPAWHLMTPPGQQISHKPLANTTPIATSVWLAEDHSYILPPHLPFSRVVSPVKVSPAFIDIITLCARLSPVISLTHSLPYIYTLYIYIISL